LDKSGHGTAISDIGMKGMLDALMNKFISPISKGLVELINIFFVEAKSDEHGLEIPSDTYAPNNSIFKGKYILCSSCFLQFFSLKLGVDFWTPNILMLLRMVEMTMALVLLIFHMMDMTTA
jgi:hypothetical protein